MKIIHVCLLLIRSVTSQDWHPASHPIGEVPNRMRPGGPDHWPPFAEGSHDVIAFKVYGKSGDYSTTWSRRITRKRALRLLDTAIVTFFLGAPGALIYLLLPG